jgi:hypothetical protein
MLDSKRVCLAAANRWPVVACRHRWRTVAKVCTRKLKAPGLGPFKSLMAMMLVKVVHMQRDGTGLAT